MGTSHLFSGEAVSSGHPDKLCDRISAAVVDAQIKRDATSRVGCETMATRHSVIVACEIKSGRLLKPGRIRDIAKRVLRDTGYDGTQSWNALFRRKSKRVKGKRPVDIHVDVNSQSPEITSGIAGGGAGDQGMMFGYAERGHHTEHMPDTIWFCNRIMRRYDEFRVKHSDYGLFGPDAKCQLTLAYDASGWVQYADSIVVSAFHHPDLKPKRRDELIKDLVAGTIPPGWIAPGTKWHINPAGPWSKKCGPAADIGLTGRKIIVDAYGGHCPHGGGAFSGKDPSKVDVTGAYAARYIAKNLVHVGYADRCTVQLSYAIGIAEPQSVCIDFHGTDSNSIARKWGSVPMLADELMKGSASQIMDLTPNGIIAHFDLLRPIYEPCSAYGHFGRKAAKGLFPWEATDLVSVL